MTVAERIKTRINELDPKQQEALLTFLETLESSNAAKPRTTKKRASRKAEISAAVRGIAGIWKDRTDLPKDPVEAVKAIRVRMWSRGRNG